MPRKGQPISAAHRKAIADANRRRKITPEMRENCRKAQLGKKLSEEHKKKLSEALSGEKNPFYGRKHTPETIEKIRRASTGKPGHNLGKHLSDETKEKLRKARLGKKLSVAHRVAIGRATRGKKRSEETKKKLSISLRNSEVFQAVMRERKGKPTGRTQSEEAKRKSSLAHMGRPAWNKGIPHTEEIKRKMRERAKFRPPVSKEAREKMRQAHTGNRNHFYGKKHSSETREKMSGPNNHGWKGGHKRHYGPEWTNELKANIRKRDGYQCLLNPSHVISGYFKVPDVHHIVPFLDVIEYQLDHPHRPENLASLCRKCHGWADANLDISIPTLQSLLVEKYNYRADAMLSMPKHTQKS